MEIKYRHNIRVTVLMLIISVICKVAIATTVYIAVDSYGLVVNEPKYMDIVVWAILLFIIEMLSKLETVVLKITDKG